AAEVARAVFGLADDVALLVELRHENRDMAGLAVEHDAGLRRLVVAALVVVIRSRVLEVGREDGLLDDLHEFLERDLALALHEPQHSEVDIHGGPPLFRSERRGRVLPRSFLYGTRVRA